jgi:hypothetical protein
MRFRARFGAEIGFALNSLSKDFAHERDLQTSNALDEWIGQARLVACACGGRGHRFSCTARIRLANQLLKQQRLENSAIEFAASGVDRRSVDALQCGIEEVKKCRSTKRGSKK